LVELPDSTKLPLIRNASITDARSSLADEHKECAVEFFDGDLKEWVPWVGEEDSVGLPEFIKLRLVPGSSMTGAPHL
jgi:hypothetical protein